MPIRLVVVPSVIPFCPPSSSILGTLVMEITLVLWR